MTFKEFFSGEKARFFWFNIIGMAIFCIVLVFVALKGLDFYTKHGEGTAVPKVTEMKIEEATMLLKNHGLEAMIVDSVFLKTKPAGLVMEQNPASGNMVKSGRSIYLVINTGQSPTLTIPDIIDNCSYREAEARLKAAGFKLGAPQFITGEKDWVYGIKNKGITLYAGDKIRADDVINLQIGDGGGVLSEIDMTEYGDSAGTDSIMPQSEASGQTTPPPAKVEKTKTNNNSSNDGSVVDDSWF